MQTAAHAHPAYQPAAPVSGRLICELAAPERLAYQQAALVSEGLTFESAAPSHLKPSCFGLKQPMGGARHVGAPVPDDDWQRVEALHRLKLLDTDEEDSFTAITTACSQIFEVCDSLCKGRMRCTAAVGRIAALLCRVALQVAGWMALGGATDASRSACG